VASNDIDFNINAKTTDATKSVQSFANKTEASLGKIEKQIKTTNLALSSFLGNFAANAAGKALELTTNAAKQLFNTFIVDGVKAAQAQEDAINELNFALSSTGIYSKKTADDMQELANALQATTKFEDDVILKNAALIQNLGRLDKEGLKAATKAALDLSAALGIDLTQASTLVGKAAQGEVSMFKRYGIEIRKGATDAESFANALEKLNRNFGGAAAAQVNTFSGATARLKNTFGDLQEEFGNTIIKSKVFTSAINIANGAIQQIIKYVQDNQGQIRALLVEAISGIISGVAEILRFIQVLDASFASFRDTLSNIPGIRKIFAEGTPEIKAMKDELSGLESVVSAYNRSVSITGGVETDRIKEVKSRIIELKSLIDEKNPLLQNFIGRTEILNAAADKLDGFSQKVLALQSQTKEQIRASNQTAVQDIQLSLDTAFSGAEQKLIQQQESFNKEIDAAIKQNELLNNIDTNDKEAKLEAEQRYLDQLTFANQTNAEAIEKIRARQAKNEEQINKAKNDKLLKDQATFFSTASTLQNAKTKELQMIGKAAAITDIAIKTPPAVASSFAFGASIGGPVLGYALAAIAATAMAAQAANIAGVALASGGIIPSGFPNDSMPARLTSGERVVNVQENKDLTAFLARQDRQDQVSTKRMESLLEVLINVLEDKEQTTIVNIGNREIIKEVRAGLRAGYSLEVG